MSLIAYDFTTLVCSDAIVTAKVKAEICKPRVLGAHINRLTFMDSQIVPNLTIAGI